MWAPASFMYRVMTSTMISTLSWLPVGPTGCEDWLCPILHILYHFMAIQEGTWWFSSGRLPSSQTQQPANWASGAPSLQRVFWLSRWAFTRTWMAPFRSRGTRCQDRTRLIWSQHATAVKNIQKYAMLKKISTQKNDKMMIRYDFWVDFCGQNSLQEYHNHHPHCITSHRHQIARLGGGAGASSPPFQTSHVGENPLKKNGWNRDTGTRYMLYVACYDLCCCSMRVPWF